MSERSEPVRTATRRWWAFAEDDLKLADLAANPEDPIYGGTLFHAQQAVEKALKTVLVAEQIPFERTHDLHRLLQSIPEDWSVRNSEVDIDWLTDWAVVSRYPANLPDPTRETAERALKEARTILDLVRRDLEAKRWLP